MGNSRQGMAKINSVTVMSDEEIPHMIRYEQRKERSFKEVDPRLRDMNYVSNCVDDAYMISAEE
jgi:hypothetical protein